MSAIEKINDIFSLKRFVPLNELGPDKLKELIENSSVLQFKKGQPLFSGIEKNHNVYLLSGNVVRSPNSDRAMLIKAGDSHARHVIMSPKNRPRMVAANSVTVLCIDAELLDLLLNWGGDDGLVVDEINTDDAKAWVDGLLQSETILSLSPQSIQILMSVVEPIEVNANEVVFNQGDKPDYYYMISRGGCVVTRRVEGQDSLIELARLGPGDAFGEEALIANTLRGATVSMSEDGLLLRLDQRNFKELLEQSFVHTINVERASRLKANGAIVLDLRSATSYSGSKDSLNIPFTELRSRIDSLDKSKKYIVVSDDNNLSAVGAFLLSKKRFKVYLLKTAEKGQAAANPIKESTQVKDLEAIITQLQQQLSEANNRLQEEEQMHAASKVRIYSLESDLKEMEEGAKEAILEAGTLKNRSESFLRDRINALTSELEKEKQNNTHLNGDNETLRNELVSLQGKLVQISRQAESSKFDVSEAQNREALLGKQLKELQTRHEKVLNENQQLSHQLNETSQKSEHQRTELNNAQEKLQIVSVNLENLEGDLQVLQVRNVELERDLEQSLEEKQLLDNQVNAANQVAEQQAVEINELQEQLHSVSNKAEKAGQEIEVLHGQQSELKARLERELEEKQELSKQLDQAAQKVEQHAAELDGLQDELYGTSRRADQNYKALQQQLESKQAELVERKAQFAQAKSSYKQQIDQLGAALGKVTSEAKQLSEQVSKQNLRNQVLIEEMSKLQGEKKRSGFVIKLFVFVSLLLVIGAGAAYYLGIDLYTEANVLMEEVAPQFNELIDSIPEQFKSDNLH